MANVASAWVELKPSAKGFGRQLESAIGGQTDQAGKRSGKRLGGALGVGIGGAAGKMFAPIAAGVAAIGVGSFFKDAIGSASDLSESGSKVGVVFGRSAAQIVAASKTSATSMGMTEAAYMAANGTLGNLMVSLGVAPAKAAGMSQEMVKLAGDMASFNNVPIEDALAAIQSGLTGETEPLKAFGVNMNDATLKAQALKMGLIKTTKEAMDPQTKALAAQALIMAQTGTAQGDFARTSGGLANQQKILGAQFDNIKTKIGGALLPVMTQLVTFMNTSIGPAFASVRSFIAPVVAAIQGFFNSGAAGPSKFAPLIAFFNGQLKPAFMGIVTAVRGFVAVALPIVQAFVTGMMARIRPMLPTIRAIFVQIGAIITSMMGLYKAVIERVTSVISFIWQRWGGSIMSFITGVWAKVLVIIKAALGVIQGIIKTVTSVIKGDWSGAWNGIKQILSSAWDLIKGIISGALRIIGGVISGAWALIKAGVSAAWSGIKSLISSAWDSIKSAVTAKASALVSFIAGLPGRFAAGLSSLAGLLVSKGSAAMESLRSAISTGAGAAVSFMAGLPGRLVSGIGSLGGLLVSAGGDLLRGLANGITGAIGGVIDAAKKAASAAVNAVKGALGIGSPSKVFADLGRSTGQGFADGISGSRRGVNSAMTRLVQVPRAGSLDFATPGERSRAVAGGIDYDRLAQAMTRVRLAAVVTPSSLDRAMGAGLR